MSTKECDLVIAVFLYVARAIAEGDMITLQRIKLGYHDLQLFNELTLEDMYRLALSEPHNSFLEIIWKPCDLRSMLEHVATLRKDSAQKLALVDAGAPRELMALFYQMSNKEYSGYLALVDANYPGGRPKKADDEQSYRVWQAWQQISQMCHYDQLSAEQYLALAEQTGVSLRVIWSLLKQWSAEELARSESLL